MSHTDINIHKPVRAEVYQATGGTAWINLYHSDGEELCTIFFKTMGKATAVAEAINGPE